VNAPAASRWTCAVWFDIDGTLLNAGLAGRRAYARALAEAERIEDDLAWVRFAGATDLDILRQCRRRHGRPDAPETAERFFSILEWRLREELTTHPPSLFPGVRELIAALARSPGVLAGLITGNTGPCARIKLEAAGIHGPFVLGAYGHEHGDRIEIARIALSRARRHGLAADAPMALVGDTPADIAAGHAVGARVLAVATGRHTVEELTAAGADRVEAGLTDTKALQAWLTHRPPAEGGTPQGCPR
jgi:phosphoglycolate phosphatase